MVHTDPGLFGGEFFKKCFLMFLLLLSPWCLSDCATGLCEGSGDGHVWLKIWTTLDCSYNIL